MKKPLLLLSFLLLSFVSVSAQSTPAESTPVEIRTDTLLLGTWMYVEDRSTGSGATFVDYVQKTKWVFRKDGTYEKGAQLIRTAGQTSAHWTESTEKGTWRSKEGKLYAYLINGQMQPQDKRLQGTYYIEGTAMIFTDVHGKKSIWRKDTSH